MTPLCLLGWVVTATLSREARLDRDLVHAQKRADLAASALEECQVERDARLVVAASPPPHVAVAQGHAVLWTALGASAGAAAGYAVGWATVRPPLVTAGVTAGGAFVAGLVVGLLADD